MFVDNIQVRGHTLWWLMRDWLFRGITVEQIHRTVSLSSSSFTDGLVARSGVHGSCVCVECDCLLHSQGTQQQLQQ